MQPSRPVTSTAPWQVGAVLQSACTTDNVGGAKTSCFDGQKSSGQRLCRLIASWRQLEAWTTPAFWDLIGDDCHWSLLALLVGGYLNWRVKLVSTVALESVLEPRGCFSRFLPFPRVHCTVVDVETKLSRSHGWEASTSLAGPGFAQHLGTAHNCYPRHLVAASHDRPRADCDISQPVLVSLMYRTSWLLT
jgi:hypothetical protein